MPQKCSVCNHPQREKIDRALVRYESLRNIAKQFNLHYSTVYRHREHIPASLVQAEQAAEATQADNLLEETRQLQRATLSILARSYSSGDYRTALSAIREARGNLELLGALLGELQRQAATVNVLVTSPDWLQLRSAILHALEPYPDARQAVVLALGAGK